jgi:hypothetical protein
MDVSALRIRTVRRNGMYRSHLVYNRFVVIQGWSEYHRIDVIERAEDAVEHKLDLWDGDNFLIG